jgi:hypothetical protein
MNEDDSRQIVRYEDVIRNKKTPDVVIVAEETVRLRSQLGLRSEK